MKLKGLSNKAISRIAKVSSKSDDDLLRTFKQEGRSDGIGAAKDSGAVRYYSQSSQGSITNAGFQELCDWAKVDERTLDAFEGLLEEVYEQAFEDGWNGVVDDIESTSNPHMAKFVSGENEEQYNVEVIDLTQDERRGGRVIDHVFQFGKEKTLEKFNRQLDRYGDRKDQYVVQITDVDGEVLVDNQGGGGGVTRDFAGFMD